MRFRPLFAALTALAAGISLAQSAAAQERPAGDPYAGGLLSGDYLRVAAGTATPVSAKGSLRDWDRGVGFNVVYENWQPGGSGVGRVGFGLGVGYSFLPLNEKQFLSEFTPGTGGPATSATATKAGVLEILSNIRLRIPAPFVAPAINLGLGFINWAPGQIRYTTATGSGTARQPHRSGAEVSIGGSVDRQIYDRWAVYAEAMYVYGYTSFGGGISNPGSSCIASGCDPVKNTTLGMLRGGLRVRIGN